MLEVDRQQLAALPGGFDHGVGLGHFERHRLLDQHVAAGAQAVNRDLGVIVVGRDDHGHVGLQLADHLPVVGIEGRAEHLGALAAGLLADVAHADQIYERLFDGGKVHAENTGADADDGKAQFHGF